jgi:hypothetical protein
MLHLRPTGRHIELRIILGESTAEAADSKKDTRVNRAVSIIAEESQKGGNATSYI